jgi:hypothetical protein
MLECAAYTLNEWPFCVTHLVKSSHFERCYHKMIADYEAIPKIGDFTMCIETTPAYWDQRAFDAFKLWLKRQNICSECEFDDDTDVGGCYHLWRPHYKLHFRLLAPKIN